MCSLSLSLLPVAQSPPHGLANSPSLSPSPLSLYPYAPCCLPPAKLNCCSGEEWIFLPQQPLSAFLSSINWCLQVLLLLRSSTACGHIDCTYIYRETEKIPAILWCSKSCDYNKDEYNRRNAFWLWNSMYHRCENTVPRLPQSCVEVSAAHKVLQQTCTEVSAALEVPHRPVQMSLLL